MPDDDRRAPLSPFWWEGTTKDADEYAPPPFSPLWWKERDHHSGGELPLLLPLGLNDEKTTEPNKESPPPVADSPAVDEEFQQKVNAAYETLPPTIRALPDFPPIEILEEPLFPNPGGEILGRFFGIPRSKKLTWVNAVSPTMIHVYRGPVLRCAGNRLDAVLKTVVWHEVAHWLGFTTEQEIADLGLQLAPPSNTGR